MTTEAVERNIGRRFQPWVRDQVLNLAAAGVDRPSLGIAAEIARQVGATAGTISAGQGGVVILGLASQTATVDVDIEPGGSVSVSVSLTGDEWQGGKAAAMARLALWGRL
jgi:hypothetical protein